MGVQVRDGQLELSLFDRGPALPGSSPSAPGRRPGDPIDPVLLDAAAQPLVCDRSLVVGNPRQWHGEASEKSLKRLLGLPATRSGDIFDSFEADGTPISFKARKLTGALCLGSLARISSYRADFVMVVSDWQWRGDMHWFETIRVLHVPIELWRSFFPLDMSPFLNRAVFSGITNSKVDNDTWATRRKEIQRLWKKARPDGSPISISPKRDSKDQLRAQSSIPVVALRRFVDLTFDAERTDQIRQTLVRATRTAVAAAA